MSTLLVAIHSTLVTRIVLVRWVYLHRATLCGYTWFGIEYGRECWMGNSLAAGTANATASDCNMACSGMPGQLCGGPSRLSLYRKIAT
ncbi:hypothetical protein KCU76_g30, partial [Aureobasidium melanogenum]